MRRATVLLFALTVLTWACVPGFAAEEAAAGAEEAAAAPSEGPPLPLHTIEGCGGGALVPMAYLVNVPTEGVFGRPAIGTWYACLDRKDLNVFTITETIRLADAINLEFGYAYSTLQLGDFTRELQMAGLPDINTTHVGMHTFSVRTPLWSEGAFGQSWMPALTIGVHYKENSQADRIDRRLGGALRGLGMRHDSGFEFTLSATKMFTGPMERPMIVTLGTRVTEANQTGFLGFNDSFEPMFEASVIYLVAAQVALVAEYRMKPDRLNEIPTLVGGEDDWWDIGIVYIFNEHLTATAAYLHVGEILDEDVDGGFILGLKYEF